MRLLWCLFSGLCALAEAKTRVEILTETNYPPYVWQEGEEVKGIYVDIVRNVTASMEDYEVVIKALPWRRGLSMVEQGSAFAIFPPYYQPDNRPWMWPYSQPLLDEELVVMCGAGVAVNTPNAQFPADYHGLRFGINAGYMVGGDAFWQAARAKQLDVEEVKGNRENLLKMIRGRVDCTISDRLSLLYELLKMTQTSQLAVTDMSQFKQGPVLSREQGFIGYSRKGFFPFRQDFVEQFDKHLYQLKKRDGITPIVEHYLGKSPR
ncbi:substrate-binding periplasmic protein [Aeromonas salmonicida]|uniref:substrate-binding periplasmic protein n=1 Tax=Aeromonas salmonicida TaxID=645 RepID=UPI00286D6453|nr:transporter substrate-binding domain-containing protein [Aeromonas salmonicida]